MPDPSAASPVPPLATTRCGILRGTTEDGVTVFRAVPYGALRFQPPAPPAAWTGERDASAHVAGERPLLEPLARRFAAR